MQYTCDVVGHDTLVGKLYPQSCFSDVRSWKTTSGVGADVDSLWYFCTVDSSRCTLCSQEILSSFFEPPRALAPAASFRDRSGARPPGRGVTPIDGDWPPAVRRPRYSRGYYPVHDSTYGSHRRCVAIKIGDHSRFLLAFVHTVCGSSSGTSMWEYWNQYYVVGVASTSMWEEERLPGGQLAGDINIT